MRKHYIVIFVLGFLLVVPTFYVFPQVAVNTNNSPPDPSAGLDINFNNKGLLPPRMTYEQRNAIPNPVEGLLVYCINCNQDGTGTNTIFQGGKWMNIAGSCVVPASPPAGSQVQSGTSMIWKWSKVPITTGYKWNDTNNYASATDLGNDTSTTETGLTCDTSHTRFIWAYNGCGHSTPVLLSHAMTACCPASITINHIAGAVAPVTKTVTYDITTNIPGLTSVCWITRNLGAGQQATTVSDTSEPSAGWYWQFNLKQGYQHDGTIRTPNTSWIASISEMSDWIAVNDPCTLELGASWRIPTAAEWTNVNTGGNWVDWNGPWNSDLKMHSAGYLITVNGAITSRGSLGYYWGSTHNDHINSWGLNFAIDHSYLYHGYDKANGYSVRCLKVL